MTCVDVNECTADMQQCDAQTSCMNLIGSYYCQCSDGYDGDGISFVDIDECISNPCDQTVTKLLPYMTAHVLVVSMVMVLHLRTK